MRFEQSERFGGGHVGNEAQVELRDGFAGKNRFAARSSVAADEAFDIDRGAPNEQLEGFLEADIVNPVLNAEKLFGFGFVHTARGLGDHFLFGVGQRTDFGGVALDSGIVAVGRDQGSERFDKMPRRAVEARLVAGVYIFARAAAPALAAGSEFAFDDAFG